MRRAPPPHNPYEIWAQIVTQSYLTYTSPIKYKRTFLQHNIHTSTIYHLSEPLDAICKKRFLYSLLDVI